MQDADAIALAHRAHGAANILDCSDCLVAEHAPRPDRGHVTVQDVQVGAADRGGVDPDDHVRIVGDLRVRYFLDASVPGRS